MVVSNNCLFIKKLPHTYIIPKACETSKLYKSPYHKDRGSNTSSVFRKVDSLYQIRILTPNNMKIIKTTLARRGESEIKNFILFVCQNHYIKILIFNKVLWIR